MKRSTRLNEKRHGSQKKKETALSDGFGLGGADVDLAIARKPRLDMKCHALRRPDSRGPASGLLQSTCQQPRSDLGTGSATPVELCYSAISEFARQHIRGYHTAEPALHEAASGRKRPFRRGRTPNVPYKLAVSRRTGRISAVRRESTLVLERERLANHLSHKPGQDVTALLKQGKYRSLRRRIANLHFWDTTVLDLRGRRGRSAEPLNLIAAFAALDRSLYPTVERHTRKIVIKHAPRCTRWSARLFNGTAKHDVHQAWKNWSQLDVETRRSGYQRLLIYLLHRKPGRAMQFIHILANDSVLPGRKEEAIADALGHLSKLHRRGNYGVHEGWTQSPAAAKQNFVPAFLHVFRKALARIRNICSQDLLYNLVDLAEPKDLQRTFDCLVEHRIYLGFDTILHYANAFAKAEDFTYALRCIKHFRRMNTSESWNAVSQRERLRWTCALILRKSVAEGQGYHNTPGIVEDFVRLGIDMDILLYNVVMHNAMEANDYSTAFKIYNTLEANGLEADKHTYSILLHGCATQSNPATFAQFASHCADVAKETEDVWLASDYLHYLYVRHQNGTDKAQTLELLQQQYLRFFSSKPLEPFSSRIREISSWMTRPADSGGQQTRAGPDNQESSPSLQPPPVALYIVLQAQIQAALANSSQQVEKLYERFRSVMKEDNDPALARLTSNPIIWNAFLLAFCSKQQFASASQLIKHMTEGSPQPNIYSWNIFMQAFFKTSQVKAAERVFEILRSRGIDPDGFTYGVLLRGYARAQHLERIGEAMQHVDGEQEMDPDLLRILARIPKRDKLMGMLEKSRILKEVQAAEKARKEAAEEKERWKEPRFTDDELEVAIPSFADFTPEEVSHPERLPEPVRNSSLAELEPQPLFEQQEDFLGQPQAPEPQPLPPAPIVEVQQPPPPPPKPQPFDPEVQYRKLQEELGIVAPSSQPQTDPAPAPIQRFGASFGFKSMLPTPTARPSEAAAPSEHATPSTPAKLNRLASLAPKKAAYEVSVSQMKRKKGRKFG